MATVDSTQSPPLGSPAGRKSGRGGRGSGRGRVAFLNFGRRGQQPPQDPLQEQSEPQEPPEQSGTHSQQPSDRDRRGRSRRSRSGRSRGKGKETGDSSGRATPASEEGEATAENDLQPQHGNDHSQYQKQDSISDEGSSISFSLNKSQPKSSLSGNKSQMTNVEKVQALVESHRERISPNQQNAGDNPISIRDTKKSESQKPSAEIKPPPSSNLDPALARGSTEPPNGPRQANGKRKGKEKEKRGGDRSRGEGNRQRQVNLPQGSHLLGDAPMGAPPNQRHGQPMQRRFGANLTEDAPEGSKQDSPQATAQDGDHSRNSHAVQARVFGGQLTQDDSDDSSDNGKLRPSAATFESGKPVENLPPHLRNVANRTNTSLPKYDQWGPGGNASAQASTSRAPKANTRNNTGHNRDKGKQPQMSKLDGKKFPLVKDMRPHTNTMKDSDDIGTRVHKEIASGAYECMVCYGGLTRRTKVWNCKCCWAVFHLHCITKWAKQGLEQLPPRTANADGEFPKRNWRCPACNNPEDEVPDMYTCWCEKTVQPEATKYLPPHSCGQTCGKTRTSPKKCPHACDLQCHAGPCPPCTAIGPVQSCYCGSENSQKRCVDTDYETGWSCEKVCDDFMPCGEHTCPKICHPGLCGACEAKSDLKCYCGSEIKGIKCCDRKTPIVSLESDSTGVSQWLGYWDCDRNCGRPLDCGVHHCQKGCHPQDVLPAHCALSPDIITHCPCGKTNLNDILPEPRQSCEDPIPTCNKVCHKVLKCGHLCQRMCHSGDCGMCYRVVEVTCRCGKTGSNSLCHQGEESAPPECMRTCKTSLNCSRHECGDKCCAGESKAMERLASKKKKPFNSGPPNAQNDDGFEPEHICTRPCGRVLKCGTHSCPMLCHRGACGTCLEASFEDLSCNCGRTITPAPVPCGAKPPACKFQCTRQKDCNHPMVPHPCHPDEESCPNCPYLVEKTCLCGKKSVKSVPCWRDTVSCGTECGKKLSCGSHSCHKICHKGGQCDEPCKQECGKPKTVCGHGCLDACHAPFQCSEDKPCTTKVQLKCACGGLKQDTKCGATKTNPNGNQKELKCTDACRSRRMALALEIDPERDGAPLYSDETLYFYNKDKKFATTIEAKFRSFAEGSSKRLTFQPMRSPQRTFLHILAADFGFDSESQDPEPYRSVVVLKGSSFTTMPRKTIAEHLATKPTSAHTTMPVSIQQLRKPPKQAYNSLIIKGIRVGLLAPELEKELEFVLKDSQLRFNLTWTGDEEVLLEPKTSSLATEQIELELTELSPRLKRLVAQRGIADNAELCTIGRDGQIMGRQGTQWSTVASNKGSPPARLIQTGLNTKNGFSMLGNGGEASGWIDKQKSSEGLRKKLVLQKKTERTEKEKGKEREVVDDWETAADDETTVG